MLEMLLLVTLGGYLLGVVLAAVGTVQRSPAVGRIGTFVFGLSWLIHGVSIALFAIAARRIPLLSAHEYLTAFAWAVMGLHFYIWLRHRVAVAALVLPPLAAIALAAALVVYLPSGNLTAARGPWFLFHTGISTLGMAILGVAFAMALLYLAQDRALKSRRQPGLLKRLPALEECDRIGYQALIVGFVLLSLGIATGAIVNASLHHELWSGGPKQVFPFLAWGVFSIVLVARSWFGYRGRRSALLTIAGFVLGLASVLGMAL